MTARDLLRRRRDRVAEGSIKIMILMRDGAVETKSEDEVGFKSVKIGKK